MRKAIMPQTILLVDKDAAFVDRMRQGLVEAGYRVVCARGAVEAERILDTKRPDMVITEVMLEHPDGGFCLAAHVKRAHPGLPVLMVSEVTWKTGLFFGLSTPEERAWIKADAFIDKPVRFEELEAQVRRWLPVAAKVG